VCVCLYSLVHSQFFGLLLHLPLYISSSFETPCLFSFLVFSLDRKKFVRLRRWVVYRLSTVETRLKEREREMRDVSHNDRLVAWLLSPFSLRERKLSKRMRVESAPAPRYKANNIAWYMTMAKTQSDSWTLGDTNALKWRIRVRRIGTCAE
jgi:hypothetical protein